MKKSELKSLIKEVISEVLGNASIVALIDNNVFPHSSDDLEKMADQYHLQVKFVGDATFGTETLAHYRLIISGPQGQLDAFVHGLAEENGIEFHDTNDSHKITEDGVGNGWQKASLHNASSDEGSAWRTFATKVAKGNKDLERTFYMAISTAEDNGNLQDNAVGTYTSHKYMVEVDLHKGTYKITKL